RIVNARLHFGIAQRLTDRRHVRRLEDVFPAVQREIAVGSMSLELHEGRIADGDQQRAIARKNRTPKLLELRSPRAAEDFRGLALAPKRTRRDRGPHHRGSQESKQRIEAPRPRLLGNRSRDGSSAGPRLASKLKPAL